MSLMEKFTFKTLTSVINQRKTAPKFLFDKFFKTKKAILGKSVEIRIKKGAGIVLQSVSSEARHLIQDRSDEYILTVPLPRFPLKDAVTAAEMNELKTLEGGKEQLETLSKKIGEILGEHKDSYMTTIEHMCGGALVGQVTDGKGKVLFEFKTTATEKGFTNSKEILASIREVDTAILNELGHTAPYEMLCGSSFITSLSAKCVAEKLFEQQQARWITEGGSRILEAHGIRFIPYAYQAVNAAGDLKTFIGANKAVAVPLSNDVFKFYYGRADHVDAVTQSPKLFFSAKEKLDEGRGYKILSETKPLPVCVRPGALIKCQWS